MLEKVLGILFIIFVVWFLDHAVKFFVFWKMKQIDKEIEEMLEDGRLD
jgi:hypothetical protein